MEREFRLPWGWSVAIWTNVAFVLVFLILPVIIIFPLSFSSSQYLEFPPRGWSLQWYRNYIGREDWVSATFLSLKVAVGTSTLATILGTLTAFGLTRCAFKGKTVTYLIGDPELATVIRDRTPVQSVRLEPTSQHLG